MSASNVMTKEKLKDFFKLLNCRVSITETRKEGEWPSLIIKVPKRYYHFIRNRPAYTMPMGVLYDVQLLGFFENRITKYKFNFIEESK